MNDDAPTQKLFFFPLLLLTGSDRQWIDRLRSISKGSDRLLFFTSTCRSRSFLPSPQTMPPLPLELDSPTAQRTPRHWPPLTQSQRQNGALHAEQAAAAAAAVGVLPPPARCIQRRSLRLRVRQPPSCCYSPHRGAGPLRLPTDPDDDALRAIKQQQPPGAALVVAPVAASCPAGGPWSGVLLPGQPPQG
jgi:hypothetical protein